MSVHVTIGSELTISGLPIAVEGELILTNTFTNPEFSRKERLGLWTGDTDTHIKLYRHTNLGLVVPRGTFPLVVRLLRENNIRYLIEDETTCPSLTERIMMNGSLYPFQTRGLNDLLRYNTGMLESPTGSGKTNIALSVTPRVKTPTVILVHTGELLKQTRERCRQWLGIEPGVLGAGKWDPRPISIAMVQTLGRRCLDEIADYFGCVIVDEAHHSPARTWADILNQLPAKYRYGFTATPFRKDGLQIVMFRTIGSITSKITKAEVEAAGKIIQPDIESVYTAFHFDLIAATEWSAMITAMVNDDDRNQLIAEEVRERLTPETRALILTDRVDHVNVLAGILREFTPVILTGELSESRRDTAMANVRGGARLTIATSSLLGEGVDVPGWDLLFLTTPMAGGPRTLQAVGRVSRAAPGKDRATIVDFVDSAVPVLVGAHSQRERLYHRT
ncbi:MAG: DEAD/DEAH box helicase [Acidobacteria bacterium]|nr:DEAD/DEAH box helicase [Acidobacteriota bacterium]